MSLKLPPYGKIPPKLLKELILHRLGAHSDRVLVSPAIGEDAAVIDMGDRVLVTHIDPITGAIENLGWLAVNVAINDVAAKGATPLWIMVTILLHEGAEVEEVDRLAKQIDEAAKRLGVAVVGGHSEVVAGLSRTLMVVAAMGEAPKNKYVTSSGARPGDLLVVTKGACVEGSAILVGELRKELTPILSEEEKRRLESMIWEISVVPEAKAVMDTGGVTAMHDATEGGVLGAIQELAWASKVGVKVYEEKVPVDPTTKKLCDVLRIDPLRTISSGSLVMTVKPGSLREVLEAVRKVGVEAAVVGEVVEAKEGLWLVKPNGVFEDLSKPVEEELWRALAFKLSTNEA